MSGVRPDSAGPKLYPKVLTDADWQKKKGKVGKLVKTGLGAELKKGEAMVSKIDVDVLDPASSPIMTLAEIDERVKAATAHYQKVVAPLMAHMKVISAKAAEAEKSLKKVPLGGDAAKAAAAVVAAADRHAVLLKSLDLEGSVAKIRGDFERKQELARSLLAQAFTKMENGIKAYLKSPGYASWGSNIKQQGRSVSNSIAMLEGYKQKFWPKWQSEFKGFDEPTLGLKSDDPEVVAKMNKLIKSAAQQLAEMKKYKP